MERSVDFDEDYIHKAYYEVSYGFSDERIANICKNAGYLLARRVMRTTPSGLIARNFTYQAEGTDPKRLKMGFSWFINEAGVTGLAFEHTTVSLIDWLSENDINDVNIDNVGITLQWQSDQPHQSVFADVTKQAQGINAELIRFQDIQPQDFL